MERSAKFWVGVGVVVLLLSAMAGSGRAGEPVCPEPFVESFEYGPPLIGNPASRLLWVTFGAQGPHPHRPDPSVAGWEVVSEDCYSGSYCLKSGLTRLNNDRQSILEVTLEILEEGEISFWVRVDSEPGYDGVIFFIDDEQLEAWSERDSGWVEASFPLEAGRHTFRWEYIKDEDTSEGKDAAWLDEISFPTIAFPCPPRPTEEVPLDPRPEPPSWELGVPRADTVPANSFTRGTILVQTEPVEVPREYTVQVPKEGADLLAVIVRAQAGGNLDLYGRAGKPVEVPPDVRRISSDFASISPGGEEVLVISNPEPRTTYWFIVENRESLAQTFTITAFLIPEVRAGQATITGSIGLPANLPPPLARYLATDRGQLGLQQYRIEVPKGAKRLAVRVSGEGDLNLHIRFGKPVAILPDGRVEADISAISPGSEEAIVLSGGLLQPGTYYIAIEGLNPPQSFTLMVSLETSSGTQQVQASGAMSEGEESALSMPII